MQSKEQGVQMKSNIIIFLHCIQIRCHLYNPENKDVGIMVYMAIKK
jgi:hypothetical protein